MPGELLISYRGYQVSLAERRVLEWYTKHPEACKRLTAGQKREPGNECDIEEIDILMDALEEVYLKYGSFPTFAFTFSLTWTLVTSIP